MAILNLTARRRLVAVRAAAQVVATRPHTPTCNAVGTHVTLNQLIAEAGDLRPLPEVARRLLAITEDVDFSMQDLAIVVGADQALTAKILRIANSPFHRHARQIGTIRDAVVLLGFRTVRSAALAACLMQSTPVETNYLEYSEFWRFSVAVGLLAEMIAGHDREVRDMAFTAGVMHNLGRLALDQLAPQVLARSARVAEERGAPLHVVQRELFHFTEGELGAALATHWNYPDALVEAIGTVDDDRDAPLSPLAEIVRQAQHAARSARFPDGLPQPIGGSTAALARIEEINAPSAVVLELARLGGIQELQSRVDAFLDGVFPDRQDFAISA